MVLWHAEGRVGRITLNRPDAGNAIHLPFARAFADAVGHASEAAARARIRAFIDRRTPDFSSKSTN